MRNRRFLIACGLVLFALLSCKDANKQDAASDKMTLAVIPKGTTHEFWKSVHAGARQAEEELGIQIIWKGPLKEDDRESQIALVEDFISRKVSGIVLAPLDDMALRTPVIDAFNNNIPVVIIDSALKEAGYISFVATDNQKGGYLAGKEMAGRLAGKGKVAMLRYQEGSASTAKREQGFLEAMAEHSGIEIVSANQYGGATTESAYRASENLLAPLKAPDGSLAVQGLFCPNESTTFGMLRALQDAKLAGTVTFIGFDSSKKLVEALRKGELHALVLQNPMRMGYLGVKIMFIHLTGGQVERRIDTGVQLVTAENMDQPRIKSLLAPDLDKWLR